MRKLIIITAFIIIGGIAVITALASLMISKGEENMMTKEDRKLLDMEQLEYLKNYNEKQKK